MVTSCYIYCSFEKASEFTSKSFAPHVPRSGCQTVPSACFAPQLCQKAKHDLANQMDPNWKARNCYSTQDAPLSIQLFHVRGEIQVLGNPDSSQTSIEVCPLCSSPSPVFFFLIFPARSVPNQCGSSHESRWQMDHPKKIGAMSKVSSLKSPMKIMKFPLDIPVSEPKKPPIVSHH